MRADRLLSLVLALSDGRLHSATELSGRFGVGVRTLYRDMALLSSSGLPIESLPGREGGFSFAPGFTLDRSVLDEGELAAVSAALGGIEGAVGAGEAGRARSKLQALLARAPARRRSWIRIELAPERKDRSLIETLRGAIEEGRLLLLDYRDAEGECSERKVEPVALVYLWQAWYLWAYCRLREGWRLFKIARVSRARALMEGFAERPEPSEEAWRSQWESGEPGELLLAFSPGAAAKADESFARDSVARTAEGGRLVRVCLPLNEWLYGFLLSFGPGLRVLEPEGLAGEIAARARAIAENYSGVGRIPKNPDRS
jgi:predicted DNA-binding transcriptional regulator YafY